MQDKGARHSYRAAGLAAADCTALLGSGTAYPGMLRMAHIEVMMRYTAFRTGSRFTNGALA